MGQDATDSATSKIPSKGFSRSKRSIALGMPERTEHGARQSDRELLAHAPASFVDTTHFDTVRFPPPEWALQRFVHAAHDGALAYTTYRGHPEVLEAVSAALATLSGVTFDAASELILTPGTQGGLFGTLSAMVDGGDKVLLVDPDYLFSERILSFLRADIVGVPLTTGPSVQPDLNILEDALRQLHPKLLVFSHPNNPTGAVYSYEVISRIAELAVHYDVWVVVDSLYARLMYHNEPFTHVVAQPGMRERTITLFGPSKTESLSGYRIGIAAGPSKVIAAIEDVQSITSLRAPAYAQHVLRSWIKDDQAWLAGRLREFAQLRQMTVDAFKSLPWLKLYPQQATAYLWPDVSALAKSDSEVATALLRDAGVLVSPGYQFGRSGSGHFRICYARDEQQWSHALDRMIDVLDRLAREKRLPARLASSPSSRHY